MVGIRTALAPRREADRGLTLVELMVAMSLLLLGLAMFGSVLFTVQQTSKRQLQLGQANDDIRIGFQELDRQMRSGYVVGTGTVGGADASAKLYTEMRGAGRCVAWALFGEGDGPQRLWTTSWAPGATPPSLPASGAGWRLVATDIVNTASGGDAQTFVMTEETSVIDQVTKLATPVRQALQVTLWVNPSDRAGQVTQLQSTFATRNALRAGEKVGGAGYARLTAC